MEKPRIRYRQQCHRCGTTKLWTLSTGRRRCSKCRLTFTPTIDRHRIALRTYLDILRDFLDRRSTKELAERHPGTSKHTILRIMQRTRTAMTRDIPKKFSGTVEVDETYMGGQWRFKCKGVKRTSLKSKRGRGTTKQPIFGILCRDGQVFAQLIEHVGKKDLQPIIQKRVRKGSTVCSDTFKSYTGIAMKGYVHRLVDHAREEYSDGKGNHINGLEGFWGYMKRQLSSKGGIRRSKLKWFLGEFVWRYNHRGLTLDQKVSRLFPLIVKMKSGVRY